MATRQRDSEESKRDFRQEFTDRVVTAIESGDKLPWERPWRAGIAPQNAVSGKEYSGMNRLMLGVAMLDAGYTDPRFVTFKQAQSLGGQVNRGESGVPIEKWERTEFYKRRDVQVLHGEQPVSVRSAFGPSVTLADGTEVSKSALSAKHKDKSYTWRDAEAELNVAYAKTYTVFNVEQCKDLKLQPLPTLSGQIEPEQRLLSIQAAMRADGLKFETGAQAFYRPGTDTVTTPPPEAFKTLGGYQSTLLHEIGHATGAAQRLSRDGITGGHRFGSPGYAREELRAELFSAFAAMQTGITRERDEQHTAYLQSWAQALKNDKHEVFKAAAEASKAMDYVLDKERGLLLDAPTVAVADAALSKEAALAKWDRFTDRNLGGVGAPQGKAMTALVQAGGTPETVKEFWGEVKHLSWPATYGQSPWETAATLGAALEARDAGLKLHPSGIAEQSITAYEGARNGPPQTVADLKVGDRFEYTAYRNGQVEVPGGERKTALVTGVPQPDERWVPSARMPDMMVIPTDNESGRIHLTSVTPIKIIERSVQLDAANAFTAPHPARPDLPGAPQTGLDPRLVPAIQQRSIEDEKQVTGRFQGVTEDDRPGRVTIHVLRAGCPLRVDVPSQALAQVPEALAPGEPIKLKFDAKRGVEIEAGRQQQHTRGAALEISR